MTAKYHITTRWYKVFLANLSLSANVRDACAAAGISKQSAYAAKEKDEQFRIAWDEAESDALEALEKQVWTWATEGDLPDKRALAWKILERRSAKYKLTEHVQIESTNRNLNLNVEAKVDQASLKDSVRILIESGALKLEDILPTGHPALPDATPRPGP